MPMYVYETIPDHTNDVIDRFEVRQSMAEPSLTVHPETGKRVQRVLSGGLATFTQGRAVAGSMPMPRGGCGSGCACVS